MRAFLFSSSRLLSLCKEIRANKSLAILFKSGVAFCNSVILTMEVNLLKIRCE